MEKTIGRQVANVHMTVVNISAGEAAPLLAEK